MPDINVQPGQLWTRQDSNGNTHVICVIHEWNDMNHMRFVVMLVSNDEKQPSPSVLSSHVLNKEWTLIA